MKPQPTFLPGMEEIAAGVMRKRMTRAWWAALRCAAKRGGNFRMARAIFYREFGTVPPANFPCQPDNQDLVVAETYPKLALPPGRREANGQDQEETNP